MRFIIQSLDSWDNGHVFFKRDLINLGGNLANFLVRVELHGAKHGDQTYNHLHSEMTKSGFKRTLIINGSTYQLPPAEYQVEAQVGVTTQDVFNAANSAAQTALNKSGLQGTPAIIVAKQDGGLLVGGLLPA